MVLLPVRCIRRPFLGPQEMLFIVRAPFRMPDLSRTTFIFVDGSGDKEKVAPHSALHTESHYGVKGENMLLSLVVFNCSSE